MPLIVIDVLRGHEETYLYELIAQRLHSRLGLNGEDIIVTIVENTGADWSFGQGRAQFLTGELPDAPIPPNDNRR